MKVIKKDGTLEDYDVQKVKNACIKAAERCVKTFSEEELDFIENKVKDKIDGLDEISVQDMHSIVEKVLTDHFPDVGECYRQYRNYKKDFVHMLDKVYQRSQTIMYIGDKENSNTDSALVSTKRSLIFNELNKEMYKKFFLTVEELQAIRDGYIYIHDMNARNLTMNCCLFDVASVMKNGFEMGNLWYNEPKTIDVAFDLMGDLITTGAAGQYGGLTVPEIDKVLLPYAKKSYEFYTDEYYEIAKKYCSDMIIAPYAHNYAMEKVRRDIEQGYQGIEMKLNSVGSSRGDYPFVTLTFGLETEPLGSLISSVILDVHTKGQGKKDNKIPTLFPKLVFLHDFKLHGKGCKLEWLYEEAKDCSSKTMYPDFLSLDNDDTTIGQMYHKYNKVISPMGCRAFLSPYYENGRFKPKDENDQPVFVGRWNAGAVSLHLPMILAKTRQENKDFYEVLDYYLNLIRKLHIRTKEYLGELRASTNPLAFCEGGFYKGHLKPNQKLKEILGYETYSFGVTALNELQYLYNKKSLVEDGQFALEVMQYINKKAKEFKEEDHMLYAIYGTPAESLCGLQIKQFRKKYGITEGVSDREYVSNSFHCGVWEDITTTQKQDLEERFWNLFEGGRIQYCKYPISYNKEAISTLLDRAMKKGFYEGINMSLSYCNDCGYEQLDMDVCPKCGSKNLTKIDRMNGYLSYSRVKGESRLNDAKMAEIKDRRSM